MVSEARIDGLSALDAALKELPVKIEQNVMRGALRAGQGVMIEAAKANIHNVSGDLANSVRISFDRKALRRGTVSVLVKAGDKKAFYAHMVEFGTAQHFIKPKNRKSLFLAGLAREVVDHPGAAPHPFMRPAIDSPENQQRAIERVRDYIAKRLPRELKKAGK